MEDGFDGAIADEKPLEVSALKTQTSGSYSLLSWMVKRNQQVAAQCLWPDQSPADDVPMQNQNLNR